MSAYIVLRLYGVTLSQPSPFLLQTHSFHAGSKHIEVYYHFAREKVLFNDLSVHYVASQDQFALTYKIS